jgi:excisionase family DNA binding protein
METDISKKYNNSNLLKAEEVAKILNISRSLTYRLMKTGQLPSVRLGRTVRVHPRELNDFIELSTTRGLEL